ncbi:MAG: glycerate kinase [Candidatus Bathyarchaeota archaeon]|nr:glycerate kinase [Candidatus Bathyarchaeota archaeon]
MKEVKNLDVLVANGKTDLTKKARKIVLESLQVALKAVDPKALLKNKVVLNHSSFCIDQITFDLEKFRNIYVIGGGKASGVMAEAIEEILGKHIKSGIVNVPYGNQSKTHIVKLHEASHPVPDEAGVEGTKQIVRIAQSAEKDDLLICLISGGGSSLMALPREGVSLEDKKRLTEALLKSGATINEVNIVRKHVSGFKGGLLAKHAYPATVLNLILSDVVDDDLSSIASGPTAPDPSTFTDAKHILKKYGIWEDVPSSIQKVLSEGIEGKIADTPKKGDPIFERVYNVIVGNNRIASNAAVNYLKTEGVNTFLLTSSLECEAKQAGAIMASICREIFVSGNPLRRPAGIVVGGETTVKVTGTGSGGRNQELTLAAALKLKGLGSCVLASLSTDGVDGPTDAAGAIADGYTLMRAEQARLDAKRFLADNDSYSFFSRLGDLIFVGQTGTNVNDISVIVIL